MSIRRSPAPDARDRLRISYCSAVTGSRGSVIAARLFDYGSAYARDYPSNCSDDSLRTSETASSSSSPGRYTGSGENRERPPRTWRFVTPTTRVTTHAPRGLRGRSRVLPRHRPCRSCFDVRTDARTEAATASPGGPAAGRRVPNDAPCHTPPSRPGSTAGLPATA